MHPPLLHPSPSLTLSHFKWTDNVEMQCNVMLFVKLKVNELLTNRNTPLVYCSILSLFKECAFMFSTFIFLLALKNFVTIIQTTGY